MALTDIVYSTADEFIVERPTNNIAVITDIVFERSIISEVPVRIIVIGVNE